MRPDTGEAVGLQFGADSAAGGTFGVALGPAENAEQVLHVVAELVGDDVLLCEGPPLEPNRSTSTWKKSVSKYAVLSTGQ